MGSNHSPCEPRIYRPLAGTTSFHTPFTNDLYALIAQGQTKQQERQAGHGPWRDDRKNQNLTRYDFYPLSGRMDRT
jgi:hypothetical protein